jgi:hypothetical protein
MSGWYLRTDSTAEAVEALATVGLWPWEIGDERAPRWWCERCEGVGFIPQSQGRGAARRCAACLDTSCVRCGGRGFTVRGDAASGWDADAVLCAQCNGRPPIGHVADPPSHAALVAVASLGRPLLLRITHALAPEIARAAGCPDARVVWRVMGREDLRRRADQSSRAWLDQGPNDLSDASDMVGVTARIADALNDSEPRSVADSFVFWSTGEPSALREATAEALPAICGLATCGVHLVALDASRIVLAVEAIGDDRG